MANETKRAEGGAISRSCAAKADSALASVVVASRASRRLRRVARKRGVVVKVAAELDKAS